MHNACACTCTTLHAHFTFTPKKKFNIFLYILGKTGQSPSLIAEHFPGTVTDFTAFSLPPQIAFTFDLPPKSDDVSLCWFHIPPRVQITLYLPPPPPDHFLCTSPTYQVALAPFHQKRCYRPYLYFYHTSPLVFRTFSLPPSTTETIFTYLS
jgi:hypothetical protein